MKTLTKQDAIERIREITNRVNDEHLNPYFEPTYEYSVGAIRELMHIFDIKEEEL